MISPHTGKTMPLKKEPRTLTLWKKEFEILYYYYLCEDSDEEFTDSMLDEVNFDQLYVQYSAKRLMAQESGV